LYLWRKNKIEQEEREKSNKRREEEMEKIRKRLSGEK